MERFRIRQTFVEKRKQQQLKSCIHENAILILTYEIFI